MNYEILLATSNVNKVKEIREILSPHKIIVYGINDLNLKNIDVVEDGLTYKDNALKKALAYKDIISMPIIADDSGIEVEALNNKPGLESARYAKNLGGYEQAMKSIIEACKKKNNYKASFICDIALINVEDKPLIFEGIVKGKILESITGDKGFGYDPIFKCDEYDKPFGYFTSEEKNTYSHRAKALKKLITYLKINGKCI